MLPTTDKSTAREMTGLVGGMDVDHCTRSIPVILTNCLTAGIFFKSLEPLTGYIPSLAKEDMFLVTFVCLSAILLKKLYMDCNEILWKGPG